MPVIQLGVRELLEQSHTTARDYLLNAKLNIDEVFGKGHAKANPGLVAAVVAAASADFNVSVAIKAAEEVAERFVEIAGGDAYGVGYGVGFDKAAKAFGGKDAD